MAIPVVGLLVGIGSSIGYISKGIFGWITKKVEALPFFILVLSINVTCIGLFLTYFGFIIKILLFVYKQLNFLITYLSKNATGSTTLDLFNDILSSMRFYEALRDVLNIYSPFITFCFMSLALKFGIKGLIFFRNNILSLVISKLT